MKETRENKAAEVEKASLPTSVVAIDFETYYDRSVSVNTLGTYHYLRHPACSIYLVAAYAPEIGFAYVGEPEQMDWSVLQGRRVIAHNVSFDRACFVRLKELGVIPQDVEPAEWCCTADMAAALSSGRSLKAASETLLGISVSKKLRDDVLKGLTWEDIKAKGLAEDVGEYCLHDAWLCYQLWRAHSQKWSERERRLSAMTREMGEYAVCIDRKKLCEGREKLHDVKMEAEAKIPWTERGESVLSPKALREECAKVGIPAPGSLAEDSEECASWEQRYGERYAWVAAMRDYRKANTLAKKLETIYSRLRSTPTGEAYFSYGLKYFGAHTGRWAGDGGVNMQNMPRGEMFGVDLRRLIIPRPGYTFVISDLGQIEQRVLSWLAGDNDMMEELEKGISVYEAHARATMGYRGEEPLKHANPDLYRLAKARVLGLGYGAGAAVFPALAKAMAGLTITPTQAKRVVEDFRRSNPLITTLWNNLERAMSAVMPGGLFTLSLPSGRCLYYRNVRRTSKGLIAEVQGKRCSFFGGKLAENLTSATARDVLGEALLRLDEAGYRVVLHVHDEVVCEVPEGEAQRAAAAIHAIMTTGPMWLVGLPLSAETIISPHYTK